MPPNDRTQGATLIVSLLLVMLMLAVIMSVTAQVTLSTRRSSADQDAILRAQYAAESGAARVQARLRAASDLLAQAKFAQGTTIPEVEAQVAAICGLTSLPSPLALDATVCGLSARPQGLKESGATNARVSVLLSTVSAAAFATVGLPGATDADRTRFWSDLFSGVEGVDVGGSQDGATFSARYGLKPLAVVKSSVNGYRLIFTVPDVTVTGQAGGATRQVKVRAAQDELSLLIERPSLAPNALFTNHHYLSGVSEGKGEGIYFTSRTLFSGPVHTNQHLNIVGKPWFGGAVSSAGCPAGQITTGPNGPQCAVASVPGAVLNGSFVAASAMPNPQAPSVCESGNTNCAAPTFDQGVNWSASYLQLPENGNDQQAAAQLGGVAIPGDVSELQLYQAPLTPGGQNVQRLTYTVPGATGPVTVQLAIDSNKNMLMWDGTAWVGAARQADGSFAPGVSSAFNGVLYVGGKVANLNAGPNSSNGGAAVASFSGLTLAAAGDINITSSLRYADPPCAGQHVRNGDGSVTSAACTNLNTRNILGIYSAQGNVNLMKDQLGNDPAIHAVLMAGTGAVQVDKYDQGTSQGTVNLIGGIIENYYGAFGTFDGDTAKTGYGRNFVFDPRTLQGYEPPFFPTARTWKLTLTEKAGTQPLTAPLRLRGDTVSAGGEQ
ncbi:DUF4900 domain-containing protein [Deinococcus sp. HMF7620]|uniref:DUF4900 domain-containing protein n=1 Tax=Deinococcus arboris TaxID=2682977 RepID=A0A7C9HPD9_9DEIO|nr:DUF4900 domain-containing protein [Deinococcus arboris]MVN85392.1 DUF4900 domain-containing protein [Deinococcus arboris]